MTKLNWIPIFGFLSLVFTGASASDSDNYHVDIRNAPVSDALRFLAKAQGINVVVPDKLPGRVNATFPRIQMPSAIGAILETNQLGSITEGDVMKVTSKKALEERGDDLQIKNFVLKFAKADKVAPQVKLLLSTRGQVMFDQRTNSVTARDTAVDLKKVGSFIDQIDNPDRQVLIEARIVEASTNYLQKIGIQWGFTGSGPNYTVGGTNSVRPTLDSGRNAMISAPITAPNFGLGFAVSPLSNLFLDTQITAAEQNGDVSVLSRPSIVTTNNQPATIHSGVKFYVKTAASLTLQGGQASAGAASGASSSGGSAAGAAGAGGAGASGGANTGIQEINSGITLVVTPQITADNKIILTINVTESQADFSNTVDGIPSIIDNMATTTVLLENASTTVIGGLFQRNVSKQRNGMPFLQNIPVLGYLFGSRSTTDNKKELMIFLKPTLIADGAKPSNQEAADKRSREIETREPPTKS